MVDMESVRANILLAFQVFYQNKDIVAMYLVFATVMFFIALFFSQFDLDSDMYKLLEKKYGCTTAMFMEWDRVKRHTRENFEKGKLMTDDPIEQHLMQKMINIRYKEKIKKSLKAFEFKLAYTLARDCIREMMISKDGKDRLVFAFTSRRQYTLHSNDQKFTKFAAFRMIDTIAHFEDHRLKKIADSCYVWIGDTALLECVEGVSCEVIHAGEFAVGTDITKPVQMDIQDLLDAELPEDEPEQIVVVDGKKYGVTNLGPEDSEADVNVLALIQKQAEKMRNRGRRERNRARQRRENERSKDRERGKSNKRDDNRRRDRSASEDIEQHVLNNRIRLENARQKIASLQRLQAMGNTRSATRILMDALGY